MAKFRLILLIILSLIFAGTIAGIWFFRHSAVKQKTFATPEGAAQALVQATERNDPGALLALFGPEGKPIISSGDPIRDKSRRTAFAERASEAMKVEPAPTEVDRAFILVGEDSFPFPVPLVRSAGQWRFDTQAGKQELLARRIGSNELAAIELCRGFVDAEYQFASQDRDGSGVRQYARRFISSPGKKDGLYRSISNEGSSSPVDDLVAEAAAEGYDTSGAGPIPYHGYNVRLLTGQGPNAEGGPKDYIVHGLMIGGFGLVAWPIAYGVSGVETFLVNQSGFVYEKDLGPETETKVQSIKVFDPDSLWKVVK
jgi:hypothetical protein